MHLDTHVICTQFINIQLIGMFYSMIIFVTDSLNYATFSLQNTTLFNLKKLKKKDNYETYFWKIK